MLYFRFGPFPIPIGIVDGDYAEHLDVTLNWA